MVNVNEKHLNLAKQVRCLHLWEENDAIEHNAKLFADFESEVRLEEAEWWVPLVPNRVSKELEKERDERIRGLEKKRYHVVYGAQAMSEFDKMLEDVAQELAEMGASNRSWQAKDNCEVLKRRLLGLLEAGQAMRDTLKLTFPSHIGAAMWDSQKQAAMEGR